MTDTGKLLEIGKYMRDDLFCLTLGENERLYNMQLESKYSDEIVRKQAQLVSDLFRIINKYGLQDEYRDFKSNMFPPDQMTMFAV